MFTRDHRQKFSVEVRGCFHTFTLYDDRGREVLDLESAVTTAQEQYGNDWQSVFNGTEAHVNPNYEECIE